jgi:hypothetical protein
MTTKYKLLVVFTCIVALVCCSLVATITLADEPENGNIIYAAYQKVNGMLRIINDPSEAKPSEKVISWYKAGASGQPDTDYYGMHYLSLSPVAFQGSNQMLTYNCLPQMINYYGPIEFGQGMDFNAPILLPDGAIVREVKFWFTDGYTEPLLEGASVVLILQRVNSSSGASEDMCILKVMDHQDGVRTLSTSTINNNIIDNEHYFYALRCFMTYFDVMPSLRGARIKYELPAP